MSRQKLIEQLSSYSTVYAEETLAIPRFLSLLTYPNCFDRSLLFGHVTASAWITDQSRAKVLLMQHAKLKRWLQPGGHADGAEDILAVATKEMTEETGIVNYQLAHKTIFDLDIHTIPKRGDVSAHEHYDFRFHFIAVNPSEIVKNNESLELRWVPVEDIPQLVENEQSILRMLKKIS
ncbi:MAG: 8-oxo-dGTP pyrophosphatase MutT (NUDIX family) [Cyclobacteriaceae bacterium]|jgi:8-oxo-dGTP pyrophosphatase MutT (NUDIX family)